MKNNFEIYTRPTRDFNIKQFTGEVVQAKNNGEACKKVVHHYPGLWVSARLILSEKDVPLKPGDLVKIVKGNFKGKTATYLGVRENLYYIYIKGRSPRSTYDILISPSKVQKL